MLCGRKRGVTTHHAGHTTTTTARDREGRRPRRELLERLTAEDAEVLRCESGNIRGHTCKVLVLEPSASGAVPTVEQLRRHIESRLDAAPRLRQRLVPTPLRVATPVWLDDPEFDIARHVTAVATAGPVSGEQLEGVVADLMTQRLDRERPLWHLDAVELDDGTMALIWRIHHCMADGTTCVRLGSAVLWSEDPSSAIAAPSTWTPRRAPGALSLFAAGLAQPHLSSGRLPRPALALRSLWTSEAVVKRELRPRASLTSLAHEAGAARSVAFARAPLAACKAAGKRIYAAVTLNDVVLALVAGGVRTWMQGAGDTAKEIRVKVPVSLHHDGEDGFAANRDSYFFVDLPVGEPDIARRVLAINRETSERKLAHDAETLYRLGRHPAIAHWAMSPRVFTFNVSNVRGPAQPIYVIDALVREMYSLGEIARRHALRFAVISFGDSLFFGLCADRDAVSGVHLLADGIRRATDELLMI